MHFMKLEDAYLVVCWDDPVNLMDTCARFKSIRVEPGARPSAYAGSS